MRATFDVRTERRLQVLDVTDHVAAVLPDDYDGVCTVFSRHTTTGVCVNEAESRLLDDIESMLTQSVSDDGWRHDELDGNADSHLRALLVGNGISIPVVGGELDLGRWQSVLLVECDGPRTRTVTVATT
ncbi:MULTISPECIES: secondary thiamine-phosphate synthase enzyme YjbQ [Haloferax]|uniref:YjbQ family protein n=1 Tax=Haloferax marinum TaxID=2666143 RepID=A0A6A8G2U8_9EURY|nr:MULTISPECIES: secondary thiamine-phosphate synthase enzyme YjbQ [Haloferax]KAB1196501.1 YjbQ family protein [Haloferax sp. CBA1150]MRW95500.1 YjbQ family protein [Haloferax marinum]